MKLKYNLGLSKLILHLSSKELIASGFQGHHLSNNLLIPQRLLPTLPGLETGVLLRREKWIY